MSRDGNGVYSLPVNSWNPALDGNAATPSDYQDLIDDVAAAITQSVSSDGQTPMVGDLNMDGNKIENLANGTANTDAVNVGQMQSRVTIITASGTHNFLSTARKAMVEVLGGGGAGGGAIANGATTAGSAGGGASGSYSKKIITLGSITSATITIGAAGVGASGANGGAGGQSVYSDGTNTITCPGGLGGVTSTGVTYTTAYPGGARPAVSTGGDLNLRGNAGSAGWSSGHTSMATARSTAIGGAGANSLYGQGGESSVIDGASGSTSTVGGAASGYGAGGGGSSRVNTTANNTGGDGAPGVVIITEYF